MVGVSGPGEGRRMEAGREWTQQGQNTDGLKLREHMKTEPESVRADSLEQLQLQSC